MHLTKHYSVVLVMLLCMASIGVSAQIDASKGATPYVHFAPSALHLDSLTFRTRMVLQHWDESKSKRYVLTEGNRAEETRFVVDGGIRGEKLASIGYASYQRGMRAGAKWINALTLAQGNPYQVADTSTGRFNTESYAFGGMLSYRLRPKLLVGANFGYNAGTAFKTADPRPKNTFFDLQVGLSAHYNDEKWLMGAAFSLGNSAEDLDIRVFTPSKKVLLLRPLGLHRFDYQWTEEETYQQTKYVGTTTLLESTLQRKFKASTLSFDMQLRGIKQEQQKSSLLTPYIYKLTEATYRVSLESQKGLNYQLFQVFAATFNGKGTENTFTKVLANPTTTEYNWIKTASSQKYSYATASYGARYIYQKGRATTKNYSKIELVASEQSYKQTYAIPREKASYSITSVNASIDYQLKWRRLYLIPHAGVAARFSHSSTISLTPIDAAGENAASDDPKTRQLRPIAEQFRDAYINNYEVQSANTYSGELGATVATQYGRSRIEIFPKARLVHLPNLGNYKLYSITLTVFI